MTPPFARQGHGKNQYPLPVSGTLTVPLPGSFEEIVRNPDFVPVLIGLKVT